MTQDDFQRQLRAAQDWARRAETGGWLQAGDTAALLALEHRSPASLFDDARHRPLLVAFFGGTGVGKSTLLNRLAGQAVARTGVERPTSREVSLYLHESLTVDRLPDHFPVERVRIAHHRDESRRQVLWIDMPDIDSIETGNREAVLEWLPHIDLLVYVVSPERYRDDKGWRLLRADGRAHAWLFALNQWDRGHPAQFDDFIRLLRQGGFDEPVVFRTDCREPATRRQPDDFDALDAWVRRLAERHLITQLESHALSQRRETLDRVLADSLTRMGDESEIDDLPRLWSTLWHETAGEIQRGLEWPIRELASAHVTRDGAPFGKSMAPELAGRESERIERDSPLWDEWTAMELQDALDRLVQEAGAHLPPAPLRAALRDAGASARKLMLGAARRELHRALASPGSRPRRWLSRLSGLCAVLLPLAAIGWVGYDVVQVFYQSEQTHSGYLGADFAIHAGLLVAVSWLLPFFLHRLLKPSLETNAVQGLRSGVTAGLAAIEQAVQESLERYRRDWREVAREGEALLSVRGTAEAIETTAGTPLARLLPRIPEQNR
jgi:hypothetical protein